MSIWTQPDTPEAAVRAAQARRAVIRMGFRMDAMPADPRPGERRLALCLLKLWLEDLWSPDQEIRRWARRDAQDEGALQWSEFWCDVAGVRSRDFRKSLKSRLRNPRRAA